jgi:hypothetical protein
MLSRFVLAHFFLVVQLILTQLRPLAVSISHRSTHKKLISNPCSAQIILDPKSCTDHVYSCCSCLNAAPHKFKQCPGQLRVQANPAGSLRSIKLESFYVVNLIRPLCEDFFQGWAMSTIVSTMSLSCRRVVNN